MSSFLLYCGNQQTSDIIVCIPTCFCMGEWMQWRTGWVLWTGWHRSRQLLVCCLHLCNKRNLDDVTSYNLVVCTWIVPFVKWGFIFFHPFFKVIIDLSGFFCLCFFFNISNCYYIVCFEGREFEWRSSWKDTHIYKVEAISQM